MTDRSSQMRALVRTATDALRHALNQDEVGVARETYERLEASAWAAEREVDRCLAPILEHGAESADDLVCLAEAARFYVRAEFGGPPVFENPSWERAALALADGVLKLRSAMA